jgi:hypothetical protein
MSVSSNIIRLQARNETSLLQTTVETEDEHESADEEEEDIEPFHVFAGETSQPKRKVRFDGVEMPARNYGKDRTKPGEGSKPTTPKNQPSTTPPKDPNPTTPERAAATKPLPPPVVPRLDPTSSSQPQYRYQSPIEDPTLAKSIINRALDTSISLSQRELLAISPDLRRQMKDLTTSKKIANEVGIQEVVQTGMVRTCVRVCDNCDGTIDMIVGKDSLPLSSVYPYVAGSHKFENVLDSGSEINAIHAEIWEAIGEPLHGSTVTMQSANNTQNETVGKLRNLRFTFGDMDLWMQMHVVEDAPYEILLGKPFFALTTCTSKFFMNGDQHITITDPNTGRTVTIPAVEHNTKNRQEMSDTGKPGWRAAIRQRRSRSAHLDNDYSQQLYIHVLPDPDSAARFEELPDETMDVDDPIEDEDIETTTPDITPSGSATPTQQRPLPEPAAPHFKISFDETGSVALQPDEDLIELVMECPPDSPEPVKSLLTLIADIQTSLTAEGEEPDEQVVEVMEFEAPAPRKDLKGIAHKKKYKKVANRVRPVEAETPPEYRIERNITGDPLADLPTLPTNPPEFAPGVRYTEERAKKLRINESGFMWPEEEKLAHHLIREQEMAFAWDESEKGMFNTEYFPPIRVATVPHDPWIHKNIPIPPGILSEIIAIVKDKLQAGTYEPSNSSYRTRWFCALKKDRTSLRIVHDLQPLNAQTIRDAAVPPIVLP